MQALQEYEARLGIRITTSLETVPLGTGGPMKLAEAHLRDGDPFFMLNSDVICDFPFGELLAFHRAHGREGTIVVTKVADPSKYGVVVSRDSGQIDRFVEKPTVFVGDRINAGIYIFNASILDRVQPDTPTSIEKEVFPAMADGGQLYCMDLPGYWMDIGQPVDYLKGQTMHLAALAAVPGALASGPNIRGNVLIDASAQVAADALVGPDVVIGPGCVVEAGARVVRSTLLAKSVVRAHAFVRSTIVGWESSVGRWTRVDAGAVLGADVVLGDELFINGAQVLPHKSIRESVPEPTIIM